MRRRPQRGSPFSVLKPGDNSLRNPTEKFLPSLLQRVPLSASVAYMHQGELPGKRELLSEREVHTQFGLGVPWLRKCRRLRSGPPFVKIGRMIRYRRADVEQFLDAHVIQTRTIEGRN